MLLARKLAFAFIAGIIFVLAINAYLRVRSDTQVFQDDMERDHRLIARVLLPAIRREWSDDGRERALQLLEEANAGIDRVEIRWIDATALDDEIRGRLKSDGARVVVGRREDTKFVTYASDAVADGALGITESLADEASYVRSAIVRASLSALAIVFICGGLAWAAGIAFVATPVGKMMEKARRIGRGDFSGPLQLATRDELSDLAREMNAMCDQLTREVETRRKAEGQLRHADRLSTVGKLASGVAHELGTPLNVISGRAKMILGRRIPAEQTDDNLRLIVEQVDRMAHIIRQLLDFARRNASAKRTRVELDHLAKDTSELLQPIAEKRGVKLTHALEAEVAVHGDRTQLQQVLSNLIMNAVQSMRGSGEVHVKVGVERSANRAPHARISVRDQGEGIAPEVLPHIFEPFFTTKEVGEGTGLGLSVVHGIIEEHGGQIAIDTELGKGTTFSIDLPLEPPAEVRA